MKNRLFLIVLVGTAVAGGVWAFMDYTIALLLTLYGIGVLTGMSLLSEPKVAPKHAAPKRTSETPVLDEVIAERGYPLHRG